jgi:hypothetical protein
VKTFTETLYNAFEHELLDIQHANTDALLVLELSARASNEALKKLKKFIVSYRFKDEAEEICFFKELKPLFTSKLVYYNRLYKIETQRPVFGTTALKKFLEFELQKLRHFYQNNIEFYSYYRSGSKYLDGKYFVRKQNDLGLYIESLYFETDPRFTTPYDYRLARILAYEQVMNCLEKELGNAGKPNENSYLNGKPVLKWTESKMALIEMIYALFYTSVFNNGDADIKQIATCFEKVFDVSLGDYYRGFLDIRMRKTSKAKFLDNLKDCLIRKMDEAEERY